MKALERTAIHEAGHVVVGRVFGVRVEVVSVVPAPACAGLTFFDGIGALSPICRAVVRAAGDVAERMAREDPARYPAPASGRRPDWLPPGMEGGRRTGEPVPEDLELPPERERIEQDAGGPAGARFARRSARGILEVGWDHLHTLASALLDRGRLEGADVETVLSSRTKTTRSGGLRPPAGYPGRGKADSGSPAVRGSSYSARARGSLPRAVKVVGGATGRNRGSFPGEALRVRRECPTSLVSRPETRLPPSVREAR